MKHALIIALAFTLIGCGNGDDATPTAPVAGSTQSGAGASPASNAEASGPTPITDVPPAVAVITEDVAYGETEEQNLRGYLVLPADAVDVPGIIMIHEQWGLNDYVRAMARRLAGEGYAVLAIDLYGGQTTTRAADAERFLGAVMRDREATLENIRQGYRYLDEFVLSPRIGVVGWSLGGTWALEAGLAFGDNLDAVVMFYGEIVTDPELLAKLEAPLLGIFAGEDTTIPSREVLLFRGRLDGIGKTSQVVIYSGLNHGFLNPGMPAYRPEEAQRAWDQALGFLDQRLR